MSTRNSRAVALGACACASLAFWLSNGSLAVESGASAARIAQLASPLLLVAALVGYVAVGARTAATGGRWLTLLGSGILILPWLPIPLPAAALVWTGPTRYWVWGGVLVAWWSTFEWSSWRKTTALLRRPGAGGAAAGLLAFVCFAGGFAAVSGRLPGGDEPHYLVITQSLLSDRDLQIENNHRQGDYRAYFDGELRPDYLRRGRNGRIYSIHAPGLAALVAPAFAMGGYRGVVWFLMALAALTSVLVWRLSFRLTGDPAAAWFAWACACLTTPFFFHAFTIYPDPVGALIVVLTFALLVDDGIDRAPDWRLTLHGAALALLPWLHSRYAVLAAALGLIIAFRLGRRAHVTRRLVAFLAVPTVGAVSWFTFFYAVYGTVNPTAPYGSYTQTALYEIPRGLTGFLIDQQFGLLPNAPVLACAFGGAYCLYRQSRRVALELAAVVVPYALVAASYHMWWAGSSSPARFVVAVVPVLGLPAAALFAAAGRRARWAGVAALLASLGIVAALAFVNHAALLYQDRDGVSLWLEWVAPLVDLPSGLPSLFRGSVWEAWRDALIWLGLLAGALGIASLVNQQFGRGPGALAALGGTAAAVMVSLTIVWKLWDVQPVTATSAQLALLQQYRADAIGVTFKPFGVALMSDVIHTLRIGPSTRRTLPGDAPLIALRNLPAGRYVVHVESGSRTRAALSIDVGRATIDQWDARWTTAGADEHVVAFPIAVPSLFLRAASSSRPAIAAAWLRPVEVAPARDPSARFTSRSAARLGSTVAYFIGGAAYLEPGGIWVRPGGEARFAFAPVAGGRAIALNVQGGPIANQCTLQTTLWKQTIELGAGEHQRVVIPLAEHAVGAVVTLSAARGFVPADVEPGNTDRRLLGCRIEFP